MIAVPYIPPLSAVVFVCSFIPVAGVVLSTVPIGLVALLTAGWTKVALVVLMVIVVHIVEAYALNPAIYSQSLDVHPIVVIGALVAAEHVFHGPWGLVLAAPLAGFLCELLLVPEVGEAPTSRPVVAAPP